VEADVRREVLLMKKITSRFANRNFMVRCLFIKYARGESHQYAECWLEQKHPYGYSIDYFDTIESARSAIACDDSKRHDEAGYKHEYVIYRMEVV
jgi:hypothetical protein